MWEYAEVQNGITIRQPGSVGDLPSPEKLKKMNYNKKELGAQKEKRKFNEKIFQKMKNNGFRPFQNFALLWFLTCQICQILDALQSVKKVNYHQNVTQTVKNN